MTTALQTFNPASMAVALKRLARSADTSTAFLKMEKTGDWVFGISGEEVPEDREFYVHPEGFGHGFVAWESDQGGTKMGEVMAQADEPTPVVGPVPDGSDGWQPQLGMALLSVDDSTPMVFRSTSVGGKRAIGGLAAEVSDVCAEGNANYVPVVTLSSESYKHKKYGRIFNPVITVVRWVGVPTLAQALAAAAGNGKAPANGKATPGRPTPKKATSKAPARPVAASKPLAKGKGKAPLAARR